MPFDSLAEVKNEIAKCMKCGNCQAVCPIYQETRDEVGVARGKITLVEAYLSGELTLTDKLQEMMGLCLVCKSCVLNCPCGVKLDKIILGARAEIAREKGLPLIKRAIFETLKRPLYLDLGMKLGSRFQRLIFRPHGERIASYPRFPIGLSMRRIIPPLAKVPLRSVLPENIKIEKPRMKVALFTGCAINYLYTDIGQSTVNVLTRNNIEVVIPKGQHCCGTPVLAHGDVKTARDMAVSTLKTFGNLNVDAYVTPCASCGGALKHDYTELFNSFKTLKSTAADVGSRVYDITEFLTDVAGYELPKGKVHSRVTYHDPCHMVKGQKVTVQPRKMLEAIPGLTFVEMSKPDRCCGNGGSFSLKHYSLSMDIAGKKMADIKGTNTDIIVTTCPGCRMQLEDGANRYGLPHRVYHIIQLLDQAYQNESTAMGG